MVSDSRTHFFAGWLGRSHGSDQDARGPREIPPILSDGRELRGNPESFRSDSCTDSVADLKKLLADNEQVFFTANANWADQRMILENLINDLATYITAQDGWSGHGGRALRERVRARLPWKETL